MQDKHNLIWGSIGNILAQVINILGLFFILRIIPIESFATFALIFTFVGLIDIFLKDLGLTNSIIQNQDIDDKVINKIFTFCLVLTLSICLFCFFTIEPFFIVYSDIHLNRIIIILVVLYLFFSSLRWFPYSILSRRTEFKKISNVSMITSIFSNAIAIYVAYIGYYLEALLLRNLLTTSLFFIYTIFSCNFKIKLDLNILKIEPIIFKYNATQSVSNFIGYLSSKIDNIIIEKTMGILVLGLYNTAYNIFTLPSTLLKSNLIQIFFPIFSLHQNDKAKIREMTYKIAELIFMVVIPVIILINVNSELFIVTFLGKQWADISLFLPYLLTALIFEIGIFPSAVLLALGKAKDNLRTVLICRSTIIFFICIGSFFNLKMLSIGIIVGNVINLFTYSYFLKKEIDFEVTQILKLIIKYSLIGIVTVLVSSFFTSFILKDTSKIYSFILTFFLSTIIYLIICWRLNLYPILLFINLIKKQRNEKDL